MVTSKLKRSGSLVFDRKAPLTLSAQAYASRTGLVLAQCLLVAGVMLVLLDNADFITPGAYFGMETWSTQIVFLIGSLLSLVLVPYLYLSSFRNFVKKNELWDREVFWILPTFFFGTFFEYGSGVYAVRGVFGVTLLLVLTIHMWHVYKAQKLAVQSDSLEGHHRYRDSLSYLTLYYLMIIALFFLVNPYELLQSMMQ
ncbi:MAG TPA: hypothetical protein PKA31_03440 [Candidatus Moranbacteria bacterium]|nr:hypothetical protein [Candidatus Moranbacteria bacterium]